jgi:hypothetical protein
MTPNKTTVITSRLTCGALALMTLSGAAAQETAKPESREQAFAGSPLTTERAARIAFAAGVELVDVHPCSRRADSCALFAVRGDDGGTSIYQLSAERCGPSEPSAPGDRPRDERRTGDQTSAALARRCFGGFTIENEIVGSRIESEAAGGRAKPRSPASSARLSGRPGEGGLPPDPQHEAQAEATNEIIEAMGEGKYEDDYDQFWADLESIQTWENPSWREPDPPPPDTIEGQALPSALGMCRPEKRALERNEPKCDKPTLNPTLVSRGSVCTSKMLPAFTPATDNLLIQNWDWDLDRFVYFDTGYPNTTEEHVDLLVASWNFLVQHRDIAKWAVCLVEGPANGRCVERRLSGETTQRYEFVDKLPIGCPKTAGMCTAFIGKGTTIKLSSWEPDRKIFFAPGQTDEEKLSVLAINAAVLLHEMVHSCLAVFTQNADDFGTGPGECGCDTPDMAEAAFAWAIAQRYPCLANSGGGDFLGEDNMWLTPCDFAYNCPPLCD